MANNTIAIKRSSVSGKKPNTTAGSIESNSSYIIPGELALNMPDKLLYTSNGSNLIIFGNKRVSETPNTTDSSNSLYLAPGDLAIDITNKKIYSSTGSEAFEVGSAVKQITTDNIDFKNEAKSGTIETNLLVVNSTTVFVGNNNTNTTVNNALIQIIDPEHSTTVAADTIRISNTTGNIAITPASIAVSNTSSNSRLSPSLVFVGNSTVNAQFNVAGGTGSFTITSYSYDGGAGLFTFNLSSNHNLVAPYRGTYITITNMTGKYASLFNNIPIEINDAPSSSSFTIKKSARKSISGAYRSFLSNIPVAATTTSGVKVNGEARTLTTVEAGTGIITLTDATNISLNTPIYFQTAVGNFNTGSLSCYFVIEILSGNRLKLSSTIGGSAYTDSQSASSQSVTVFAHRNLANIPIYTSATFTTGTVSSDLLINVPYYIASFDYCNEYASINLSTTQYGSAISINAVSGLDYSLSIGGIAFVTTATPHGYTTGQTINVNGLGLDPKTAYASFDGSYIIQAPTTTEIRYANYPPLTVTPTSMFIDNYTSAAGFNPNAALPVTPREMPVVTITNKNKAGTASANGVIDFGSVDPTASGGGMAVFVGAAIRFFGTKNGVALSGTTELGGIQVGKTYYVKGILAGYNGSTATSYGIQLSETLDGPPIVWSIPYNDNYQAVSDGKSYPTGASSSLGTFSLVAYMCGTTVNYKKDNHGFTNKVSVSGFVNATANAVISHVCFPFYPATKITTPAAVDQSIKANWYSLALTTTNIGNTYNTNLQLNYSTQSTAISSAVSVTASAGPAIVAGTTAGAADGISKTGLITVIVPYSSVPGLYGGYGTLSNFTNRTFVNTEATTYIKQIQTNGVIVLNSKLNFTVGQRFKMPSATAMGASSVGGLDADAYYYVTALGATGSETLTLVKEDQVTVPTTTLVSIPAGTGNGQQQAFQISAATTFTILLDHLNGQTLQFKDDGKAALTATVGSATATSTAQLFAAGIKAGGYVILPKTSVDTLALAVGSQVNLTAGSLITTATHGVAANASTDWFVASIGSVYSYTPAAGAAIDVQDVRLARTKGGSDYIYLKTVQLMSGVTNLNFQLKRYTSPYSATGSQIQSGGVTFNYSGNTTFNSSGSIVQINDYTIKLDATQYSSKNAIPPQIFYYPYNSALSKLYKTYGYITNTSSSGVVTLGSYYNDSNLYSNAMIVFTGTMYGGLQANTPYYITNVDKTSGTKLTLANTRGGTAITTLSTTNAPTSTSVMFHTHYGLTLPSNPTTMANFPAPAAPFAVNDIVAIQDYSNSGFEANVGVYIVCGKTLPNYLCLTPYTPNKTDSAKTAAGKDGLNYYLKKLVNFTTDATTILISPVINKFLPLNQTNSKLSYNWKMAYDKRTLRVVDANTFSVDIPTTSPTSTSEPYFYYGMFGTKDNPITVTQGGLYTSTDSTITTIPVKAYVDLPNESISGTSISGSSVISSYVEVANSSAAIKITPSTFYNGNTTANLFSNSSFLGISTPDNLLEVTPSYIFLGKAVNGVPLINSDGTGSYFYANSTNQFIGNATKYTIFDGAGNQINRGSSITVTDDINSVYIDDFSINLYNPDACTSITPSSAVFPGSVSIAGPLNVQGTSGTSGQVLLTDGSNAYWGEVPSTNTAIAYSFTNNISIGGELIVANNVTFSDSIITINDINQNYTTTNASAISFIANTSETTIITSNSITVSSNDATVNSTAIQAASITLGNTTVVATINSTSFSGISLTANNSLYLGDVVAANYVQNTDSRVLSGNLNFTGTNNYFSSLYVGANVTVNTTSHFVGNTTVNTNITAGSVSLSGATINSTIYSGTANNANNLGGTDAGSYQLNSTLSANVAKLTANSSNYLGAAAAANYVQNTDSRVLSGNLNFTGTNTYFSGVVTHAANLLVNNATLTINGPIIANGVAASGGTKVLSSTGANVYWGSIPGLGGNITVANLTITGAVFANGVGNTGTAGQILTTDGAGNVYWSSIPVINALSQSFTGDGTSTVFTLNTAVGSQKNIIVSINGLVQVPVTHYTISGSTLSFTSAPYPSAIIEARNLESGTGGSGGTGTISSGDLFLGTMLLGGM